MFHLHYQGACLHSTMFGNFLKGEPKETEVFGILGLPDSVWVADSQKYKVLYYFIESLDDYNSVEIDITSKKVNGFEWD